MMTRVLNLSFVGQGTAGPPVLLAHGFPFDASMWHGVLPALGAVGRAVAPDLPGFGGSAAASDGAVATTMDDFADHLLAVADALGLARFVLVGLSMGGYVALALARRHAERLAALVLCDTRAEPDSPEARADRLRTAASVLERGTEPLAQELPRKLLAPATLASHAAVLAQTEAMIRRASPAGVAAALRGMAERRDARPDLPALRVPTLVLVGAADTLTPPEGARRLADAIPGAELAIIPDAGHLSPLEAPAPVGAALAAFVERHAGRARP